MAVTITAPQSRVVARGSVTLSWSPGYAQSAYEVMYRRSTETGWSTFGKMTSTGTSITMDLSRFTDFVEYHYRVVLYADNKSSGTTIYNGTDTSAAYSIIVVPSSKLGSMKIKYGSTMLEIPLYNTSSTPAPHVKVSHSGHTCVAGVVDTTSAISTTARVKTDSIKSIAGATATFKSTGASAYAYMRVSTRYSYSSSRTEYAYYSYSVIKYDYRSYSYIGSYTQPSPYPFGIYITTYYTASGYYRYSWVGHDYNKYAYTSTSTSYGYNVTTHYK